jgi:hypothetical protein
MHMVLEPSEGLWTSSKISLIQKCFGLKNINLEFIRFKFYCFVYGLTC